MLGWASEPLMNDRQRTTADGRRMTDDERRQTVLNILI